MSQTTNDTPGPQHHGSLRSYIIGFALSITLTVQAYILVTTNAISGAGLMYTILALAIVQLFVQLFFFLHLDKATRTSWNLLAFIFMVIVVCIVAFGSLWIMQNLDYHMNPAETDTYIQQEERITR